VPRDLPSGTVTFLFTDVEGSTKLLHELGAEEYAEALAKHRLILRAAFGAHGGIEVDTQGDAFFVAFPTAPDALRAAADALAGLAPGPIRVRMGIHTGTPHVAEEGYVGADVHRAARIAACGHGGQVLISASTAALLDTDGLRDLGEHRLKDLSAPERIYQLGDEDFPPLQSLHQTNLPVPSTPFLGREQELTEVLGLLSQEDVRLLTLTGPGGTGKTRLGLQAAGGLADRYRHGVWWVPLAALRDPALVLATAGQALGAKDGLAEHIADKSLLLLFDNFEQVVAAAADLATLLASCPNLDLLVTSREPLHVTGEQEYPVPPLQHEEGVDFFLVRARGVRPDFVADEAVSEICRRLDELPLALELAAARVKALSTAQILERLEQRLPLLTGGARDLPERQRTLRATIEWSYELLSEEEQRLFARLAVFRGGCTLEAAEEVTEADVDTLQSLVDKSLVRHTEDRYWMLETIREYGTERFEDSGEAEEVRRRHTQHFVALAEKAEPYGEYSRDWLDRLEREHDNLRATFDRLEASGDTQGALRLAGALAEFWEIRGHLVEGRRRLERALHADERPTAARARALNGAADLALATGEVAAGRARAEQALALHRALDDAWGVANSGWELGYVAVEERDWARAQQLLEESVRTFRELGDQHSTLGATRALAWAYHQLGNLEHARALHEDNLARARALANKPMQADLLGSLANLAVDQDRVADALSMLNENHHIYSELGDLPGVAVNLCRFAKALASGGSAGTAARLLSCSDVLFEEIGGSEAWVGRMNEKTLAAIRAQLDDAAFAEAWEQGRKLTLDEAVALALDSVAAD
jgi:predicted ATPase